MEDGCLLNLINTNIEIEFSSWRFAKNSTEVRATYNFFFGGKVIWTFPPPHKTIHHSVSFTIKHVFYFEIV
jgi:hypothetical protein